MIFIKNQKRLFRITGIVLAFITFILAILLVAAHFLAPRLANYKPEITQAIESALELPVTIEQMRAKWRGLSPVIDLKNVTVWDSEKNKRLVSIEDLSVHLSVWDFIFKQKITTTTIIIDNFSATLVQKQNGSFIPQGFSDTSAQTSSNMQEIIQHIIQQENIEIRNFNWDLHLLNGKHLTIRNVVGKLTHRWGTIKLALEGTLLDPALNPPVRGKVSLHATLDPKHLLPENFQGDVILELEQIDLPTWASIFPNLPVIVESGTGRVSVRSLWNSGQTELLQTSLAVDNVSLILLATNDINKSPLHWDNHKISGDVEWKKLSDGWQVIGKNVSVTRDSIYVSPTNFLLVHKNAENADISTWQKRLETGDYSIQFNYIDLAVLEDFAQTSPLFDQKLPEWWVLGISGKLEDVSAQIKDVAANKPIVDLSANFTNLGLAYNEKYEIGFQGLTGTINLNPTTGRMHIESEQLQLEMPNIFTTGIELPKLSADLDWQKDIEGWDITGNGRSELFDQGLFTLSGKMLLMPEINNSVVDIQVEASNIPVVPAAAMYMPRVILPAGIVEWLDVALKAGTVQNANMQWQGKLKDFPYTDPGQAGKFEITVHGINSELKYHSDWPTITQLDGQLIFRGNEFYANVLKGQIAGEQIQQAVVSIPKLSLEGLDVNVIGKISGTAENAVSFLQETPLWKTFKDKLSSMKFSGPLDIDLSLNLPINKPNQEYNISGALDFKNTSVSMPDWNLTFDQVQGEMNFNNQGIYAKNLTGNFHGQPIKAQLATQTVANNPNYLAMKMQGNIDIKTLQQQYPNSVWKNWQGVTPFTADLEWRDAKDKKPSSFQVKSSLEGLSIDLPEPLNKTAEQTRPFNLTATFGAATPNVKIQYDSLLSSELYLDFKQNKINIPRGTVGILAKGAIPMPKSGIQLNANLPSADVKGLIFMPDDITKSPIDVKLSYLALKNKNSETAKKDISFPPDNFPNFNISVEHLLLNDQALGSLNLVMRKEKNALAFNSIKLINPSFTFSAAGRWEAGKMQTLSYLQGTVTSKNLGQMLKTLQLSQGMNNGKGKTEMNLNWVGSPMAWDLNTLQGDMNIAWENGHLSQVKPGLGRILSLFNVDSLTRRLRLDFSDVLKKGFTFDKLTADLNFNQGVINTKNGMVTSTSGEIDFNGKAYASNQTLDLNLTVKPSLTGPLPIAATIASGGNPLVGALALAVDKAITPKITGGVTGMHYHVTGPWQDPQIKKQ